ncbi:MAG TPA: glycosyltransferase [Methanomassiliicoccales archaeon]|nr:glycosyltransferase [Methanomassiliicoccales archaeon]
MKMSVGVCAYNEVKNIGRSIQSVLDQRLESAVLVEVIVISSGSTDGTDEVVMGISANDPRVRLIRQQNREGKNSAVNEFMRNATGDVLVLVNADNIVGAGSLNALTMPFLDEKIGVAGGRPVPVNPRNTIVGFAVNMLWDMHHHLSLIYPKVGEMMAFRNLNIQIPTGMQSDEDLIRMDLEKKGLRSVYVPEARVVNKGPETVKDYLKQRTRVNIGERYMKRWFDFDIPTWDLRFLFRALQAFIKESGWQVWMMFPAIGLEAFTRAYASIHVRLDRGDRSVWNMVETTKNVR